MRCGASDAPEPALAPKTIASTTAQRVKEALMGNLYLIE
jgi:hypothetical protein